VVTENDPGNTTEPGVNHPVRLVPELVAGQAARRPGAAAVIAGDTRLTYSELDQSATRLARYLTGLGAGPETLIGVCLERGAEAVRSLLAIMKTGSGYLPLDPALPPARLDRICALARPLAVLTAGTQIPGVRLLSLGDLAAGPAAAPPITAGAVTRRPDHLGYVICTAGSTGEPKAVAVSHGSLACVIAGVSAEYGIRPGDRVLQLAPAAVDTSVEQVLVALTRGATVMLPPAGVVAPAELLGYLERERVTVADLTPAYWHRRRAGRSRGLPGRAGGGPGSQAAERLRADGDHHHLGPVRRERPPGGPVPWGPGSSPAATGPGCTERVMPDAGVPTASWR
jgi:non-ribosomal peptide synthetase component F